MEDSSNLSDSNASTSLGGEGKTSTFGNMRGGDESDTDDSSGEFAFEDSFAESKNKVEDGSGTPAGNEGKTSVPVTNQQYDEALDLSASSIQSEATPMNAGRASGGFRDGESRGSNLAGIREGQNDDKTEGIVKNKQYDEAHELSSDDTLDESIDTASPKKNDLSKPSKESKISGRMGGDSPPTSAMKRGGANFSSGRGYNDSDDSDTGGKEGTASKTPGKGIDSRDFGNASSGSDSDSSDSDSSDSDSVEGKKESNAAPSVKVYQASDYADLNVSTDIRELFQFIGRFKPSRVELETKLQCFSPDFIPTVGEIDAFIKPKPPDGSKDVLGLRVVDEPAATQSDATILELQLRSVSKKSNLHDIAVRSIEHAEKNPKEVEKWIKNIEDLHRTKPPPTVHYSEQMPEIESLMQVWPEAFEKALGKHKLPPARMELTTDEYARVSCALMDIPVHRDTVESLHVLFTLFSEFRNNQHFRNMMDGADSAGPHQTSRNVHSIGSAGFSSRQGEANTNSVEGKTASVSQASEGKTSVASEGKTGGFREGKAQVMTFG